MEDKIVILVVDDKIDELREQWMKRNPNETLFVGNSNVRVVLDTEGMLIIQFEAVK